MFFESESKLDLPSNKINFFVTKTKLNELHADIYQFSHKLKLAMTMIHQNLQLQQMLFRMPDNARITQWRKKQLHENTCN